MASEGTETMGLPPIRFFLLLHFLLMMITASSSSSPLASPVSCGGVEIPYPFGVRGSGHSLAGIPGFDVRCDGDRPMLSVGSHGGLEILEISTAQSYVRVTAGPIVQHCEGDEALGNVTQSSSWIDLEGTPFTFSQVRNSFKVIGCDALAMIQPSGSPQYVSGCAAFCDAEQGALDQSCSGIGCCQVHIPRGLQSFSLKFRSSGSSGAVAASSGACSRAFLVDDYYYDILSPEEKKLPKLPLTLDWVIGNETCARSNSSACRANAQCVDAPGIGHTCICQDGFSGNPYHPQGCQGTDEGKDPIDNDFIGDCINVLGGYHCKCPKGMIKDGEKGGGRCISKETLNVCIGAGVGIFCLQLLMGSFWTYWLLQRRRLANVKEMFFRLNGGLLLQKQIASQKGSNRETKIFTAEEIEKATDNFNEKRILGRGGQGTVYKGILPNKRIVAIKKSRISDETQIEQFINEVVILSQINHRNVVKLIGCCLETQIPLLVYEFVPNGTLADLIHGEKHAALPLTWEQRLRIAAETAGALAYLHTTASNIPIIHRDVKTANILLDKDFTAKVADFGASRSVPFDRTHVTTLVQGTLGYLDPEYFQTSQLTEKSDVYSFGVVLVELLTREKPLSFVRPEEERNLAFHFISSLENKRLRRVLEDEIISEVGIGHLGVVARLAQRCLSLKGEERPSMKEVAMELHWARRFLKEQAGMEGNHGQADQCILVGDSSPDLDGTVGQYGSAKEMLVSLDLKPKPNTLSFKPKPNLAQLYPLST